VNGVLETTWEVVRHSRRVRTDTEALSAFARRLATELPPGAAWDETYHLPATHAQILLYILVLDSLNFCFWAPRGSRRWELSRGPRKISGYVGLAYALKQAFLGGAPITDTRYLSEVSLKTLKGVLGGTGALPLMEERADILRTLGRVLLDDYGGEPWRLAERAAGSATRWVALLAHAFPSFRDTATYRGKRVFFYKRAQIFAADLYAAFGGKGPGDLSELDALTCFADYKLPQVLRHLGVLEYGDDLSEKVDRGVLLAPGCPEEVEIRAHTVWAVERIRRELDRPGRHVRSFEIDWMLWNMGQLDTYRKRPYHRTLTTYY